MSLSASLAISASGLTAERMAMDVTANNVANIDTTRTAQGGPYRREEVVFTPIATDPTQTGGMTAQGVQVAQVRQDTAATPRLVYNPSSPDANAQGYVAYPNINIVQEMTNMMAATRAYQANATALDDTKTMAMRAIDIGKI